jgi:hypothetical protein
MSPVWEHAWTILNEHFQRLAESLSVDHPTMSWSCGHSDNEAFPFRAYASFSGRGPAEADVVISVDFLWKNGELRYSSDVALEDGQVLADGPTDAMRVTGDLESVQDQIETAIRAAAAFVDASQGLLRRRAGDRV